MTAENTSSEPGSAFWHGTGFMRSPGSVSSWCGCREPSSGRRLGARCPQRGHEGHGSWYLSLELPAGPDGRRRRIRRGGFPARSRTEAAVAAGAGVLWVGGTLPAVGLDEALDELVDVACLG